MTGADNEKRFNQLAATWDENPVRLAMTRAVALKIAGEIHLTPSMNALEFGCGTGLVTAQMAHRLGHITAIDGADNMLGELNKKLESMGLNNVTTLKVNLEKDEIPGNDYDFVYSNMTVHHIADISALFASLYDRLKTGGIIAIADLDTEDGSFHGDMPGVHHLGFPRGLVVTALEKAGFRHCSIGDAHVVQKKTEDGVMMSYPMFLAIGKKI